jgi:hypothetical protein
VTGGGRRRGGWDGLARLDLDLPIVKRRPHFKQVEAIGRHLLLHAITLLR